MVSVLIDLIFLFYHIILTILERVIVGRNAGSRSVKILYLSWRGLL